MALKEKGLELKSAIVAAADRLFYERGFNQTSFTDIAEAPAIPRGNFYYYFKSKDQILDAVVEQRMADIEAMLKDWEQHIPDPRDRLKRYVQILLNEENAVLRYGCPMGTLNMELGKTQLPLQQRASDMLELFRGWLKQQFQALGCGRKADEYALHVLAAAQGASVVANALDDGALIRREAKLLRQWIDTI